MARLIAADVLEITMVTGNTDSCWFRTRALRFSVLIVVTLVTLLYQGGLSRAWTPPRQIVDTPMHSAFPATVMDAAGRLHVVWQEQTSGNGPEEIFYISGIDAEWTAPTNISTSPTSRSLYADLAVVDEDRLLAVWVDLDSFGLFSNIYYSVKTGTGWSAPQPVASNLLVGAPTLAVNGGVAYVAWPADTTLDFYADTIFLSTWDQSGWSDPEPIPLDTGTLDYVTMAFDAQGHLHVAWDGNVSGDPANHLQYQIYYSVYDGSTWATPVNVSQTSEYSFWPSLAVDTAGHVHLVWLEEEVGLGQGVVTFDRVLYQRFDGRTWLPQPIQISTKPGAIFPKAYADELGRVHLVWSNNISDSPSFYHFRLHYMRWDGASLYGPIQISQELSNKGHSGADLVITPAGDVHIVWSGGDEQEVGQLYYSVLPSNQASLADNYADTPSLAGYGPDDLHIVWNESVGIGRIMYSHWNGTMWSNPQVVTPDDMDSSFAAIALGPDGTPHVAWYGHTENNSDQVFYTRLTATGWLAPTNLSQPHPVAAAPDIAVDQATSRIHMVWEALPDSTDTDFAIYYREGDGDQWGPTERLSAPDHNCNRPRLALDAAGRPHVVWYDIDEQEIHYTTLTTEGWTIPQNVSNTPTTIPGEIILSQGPDVAIDSQGRVHIAWMDSVGGAMLDSVYYTTNVGGEWSSVVLMSRPETVRDMAQGSGINVQVLVGPKDSLHVLWHDMDNTSRLTIYDSNQVDQVWSSPTILLQDYRSAHRPSGLLDENGQLHLVWSDLQQVRQIFYQRIDRFDWIKVVDESGTPMPDSSLYLNGQYIGKTDERGLYLPQSLQENYFLVALAPIEEYGSAREGHNSPDIPDQNWADRVYLTNWHTSPDGAREGDRVTTPEREQLLTVRAYSPLVLFNLVVSIEWDAPTTYTQQISRAVRHASDYLYDLTDGQMAFGRVAIYNSGGYWADADIQISTKNIVRPHAYVGGITSDDKSHVIRVGRQWDGNSGNQGPWDEPAGYRTLAHEFGHYALHLQDEYVAYTLNQNGELTGEVPAFCTIPHEQLPEDDAENASAMYYQYKTSELSARGIAGLWSPLCEQTAQWQINGESAWETLVRKYADTANPPRWQFSTPADRGSVMAGPEGLSSILPDLPLIEIHQAGPSAPPRQLTVYGPQGLYWGAIVALYKQDEQVIGQGFTNSNGQLNVYGAIEGDTLRAASIDGGLAGSAPVGPETSLNLTLEPVGGLADQATSQAAQAVIPPPHMQVLADPSLDPGQTDLLIFLHNFGPGADPVVVVTEPGGGIGHTPTLAYSSTTGIYQGEISFSTTERGMGRIRAMGAVGNSLVRLQSTYRLQRVVNDRGQDVYSNDGNLSLHLDQGSLPGSDAYLVIMPPGAVPGPIPGGMVLVGNPYAVTASGAMVTLEKPGILKLHYDGALVNRSSAPERLGLYRWDPNNETWQAVPGSLDEEQKAMIAAVTTLGTYALMSPPGPWSGCYDMNGDGPIDLADVQAVASRWHDPSQYDPDYDIVPDSSINILDVMKVVVHLGANCGNILPDSQLRPQSERFRKSLLSPGPPPIDRSLIVNPIAVEEGPRRQPGPAPNRTDADAHVDNPPASSARRYASWSAKRGPGRTGSGPGHRSRSGTRWRRSDATCAASDGTAPGRRPRWPDRRRCSAHCGWIGAGPSRRRPDRGGRRQAGP